MEALRARFFLGKINLNYVWLQLGPLGRKTGWDEYWEARRSLDAVLARNPAHVRARVARTWIDYIVDTRMPFGTKWLLGGGNRRRAVLAIQDAASADADFFVHAEARFALWDLQVRERNVPDAVAVARGLAADFPENPELAKYLDAHDQAITSHRAPGPNGPPGPWVARQLSLSEPFVVHVSGQSFPIVWSIVGAALFVALLHLMSGRRWVRA